MTWASWVSLYLDSAPPSSTPAFTQRRCHGTNHEEVRISSYSHRPSVLEGRDAKLMSRAVGLRPRLLFSWRRCRLCHHHFCMCTFCMCMYAGVHVPVETRGQCEVSSSVSLYHHHHHHQSLTKHGVHCWGYTDWPMNTKALSACLCLNMGVTRLISLCLTPTHLLLT